MIIDIPSNVILSRPKNPVGIIYNDALGTWQYILIGTREILCNVPATLDIQAALSKAWEYGSQYVWLGGN